MFLLSKVVRTNFFMQYCLTFSRNSHKCIYRNNIYIILHSHNSICKTSLVDMKLPVSVVLERWSSIGRNLATVAVYKSVLIVADTSDIIIFCFFFYNVTRFRIFLHGWARILYLEAKVILCHTLVTDQIVTSMTTCICRAEK